MSAASVSLVNRLARRYTRCWYRDTSSATADASPAAARAAIVSSSSPRFGVDACSRPGTVMRRVYGDSGVLRLFRCRRAPSVTNAGVVTLLDGRHLNTYVCGGAV